MNYLNIVGGADDNSLPDPHPSQVLLTVTDKL